MGWIIWIGAALLLGILEVLTVDLFFLTLAIAALGAGIFALLDLPLWSQILFFVVSSGLLLLLVRPWARDLLDRVTPNVTTNAQAYIGKSAVVTAPLTSSAGRVRIGGEEWSAKGQAGATFPVGSTVKVVQIQGATAIVVPYEEDIPRPQDSVPE